MRKRIRVALQLEQKNLEQSFAGYGEIEIRHRTITRQGRVSKMHSRVGIADKNQIHHIQHRLLPYPFGKQKAAIVLAHHIQHDAAQGCLGGNQSSFFKTGSIDQGDLVGVRKGREVVGQERVLYDRE